MKQKFKGAKKWEKERERERERDRFGRVNFSLYFIGCSAYKKKMSLASTILVIFLFQTQTIIETLKKKKRIFFKET